VGWTRSSDERKEECVQNCGEETA